VRHLLGGMMEAAHPTTIVDMEAGLEHLSRGTARHVDTLLVMLEPYYKALEIGRQAAVFGRELGVRRILAVSNKLRDESDAAAVRDFAATHGLLVAGDIPLDDRIRRGELAGQAPIDITDSPVIAAIQSLAWTIAADGNGSPSSPRR
jgi:CO dehydrogenase maturation factor